MLLSLVVVKCNRSGVGSSTGPLVWAPLTVSKQISVILNVLLLHSGNINGFLSLGFTLLSGGNGFGV